MAGTWRLRSTAVRVAALAGMLLTPVAPGLAAGPADAAPAAASAVGTDHECITTGAPTVAWSRLANPVLSYFDAGAKDEALVYAKGRWHMLFSYLTHSRSAPGGVYWNIAAATSTDLLTWSTASPWPRQAGAAGVASPDIVRAPSGQFVVTYQSNPSTRGQDKLYYRTSVDLLHWSAPHPLAPGLASAAGDRQIDAALAYTGHGVILGFKASRGSAAPSSGQHFEIAWSPNGSLAGPWMLVGPPHITVYGDTFENYEFVAVNGRWDLIATSNELDQPWIFRLDGDPSRPSSWLNWSTGRELQVPAQSWDTGPGTSGVDFEQDNSAFLCNAQKADGYYYLLYAGSSELTQFGGWGHAAIGIARSTDLVHWQLPPTGG